MAIKIAAYPGQVNFLRLPSKEDREAIAKEMSGLMSRKYREKKQALRNAMIRYGESSPEVESIRQQMEHIWRELKPEDKEILEREKLR